MFRASLCPSSGEQRPCVTAYGVLHWFCWMWLVAVVGRCVVRAVRSTPYAVTHGLCSPEDGHNDARNILRQKLIINISMLHLVGFLSLYTLPSPSCYPLGAWSVSCKIFLSPFSDNAVSLARCPNYSPLIHSPSCVNTVNLSQHKNVRWLYKQLLFVERW